MITLTAFVEKYGFNPLDNPDVTIDSSDGDARDTLTRATAAGKFISIDGWDQVHAGWKHVNIIHRCFVDEKVEL